MKKRPNRPGRDRYAEQDREVQEPRVNTRKLFHPSRVKAKSENQQDLLDAIDDNDIVFGHGPAGSGKTFLAVAKAVEALQNGDVSKIVLLRPTIGVGRTSGFLPGTLHEKVLPYLRPLMDELGNFFTGQQLRKLIEDQVIELDSLEYVRGRTHKHSFVILDEAQNATRGDFEVFLTRLGEGSKFVITGDLTKKADGTLKQCDLQAGEQGAFEHFAGKFDLDGIETVELTIVDIVRHPLVRKMLEQGL